MAKFVSLQFRTGPAGGSQILTCASVQEMWEPVAPIGGGGFVGTGWFIIPPPTGVRYPVITKDGGSPTFATLVRIIPQVRLGVIAFANHGHGVAPSLDELEDTILRPITPAVLPNPPICTT